MPSTVAVFAAKLPVTYCILNALRFVKINRPVPTGSRAVRFFVKDFTAGSLL